MSRFPDRSDEVRRLQDAARGERTMAATRPVGERYRCPITQKLKEWDGARWVEVEPEQEGLKP